MLKLYDSPPQQSFIRTVARYGYAFIAEVTVIADERTPSDAAESNPPDSRLVSPSLAVLPFANTSHDTEEEYFSDGLAGEIINALIKPSP
jgi:DNA-binding winged helix-turn-helix (wHTH) protein